MYILAGNMWAQTLLTIQTTESTTKFLFDFLKTYPEVYEGIRAVEVVMFNCPEWGISADTVRVLGALSYPMSPVHPVDTDVHLLATKTINTTLLTSCDSLVRVCVHIDTVLPIIALQFSLPPGSTWVHLAEVRFHRSEATCQTDLILSSSGVIPTQPLTTNSSACQYYVRACRGYILQIKLL